MSTHSRTELDSKDSRRRLLDRWLAEQLPGRAWHAEPIPSDAGFRRYFRLHLDPVKGGDAGLLAEGTVIAVDAPPEHENSAAFVAVARLFVEAGLTAPHVYASDLEQGLLLVSDLGGRSYRDALCAGPAEPLMEAAIEALIRWQCASAPGVLPPYDAALLQRELGLFRQWYLNRHLGRTLSHAEDRALAAVEQALVDAALAQPRVFVHRDFMPRNLMVCPTGPGILDFQDAVYGPIAYDVLSLLRDAFLSWPQASIERWLASYHARARLAGLPVGELEQFRQWFDWIGVQRHLKVIGIFARLWYRDGKPAYFADVPRFLSYLEAEVGPYRQLAPLAELLGLGGASGANRS